MSEWIELNLPYSIYLEREQKFQYPDLSARIKDIFGMTEKELAETLKTPEDPEDLEYITMGVTWEKFEKIQESIEGAVMEDSPTLEGDAFTQEVKSRLLALNDDSVNKVFAYKEFRRKVREWEENQPEVIEWSDLIDKAEEAHREKMKPLSFCGLGLNRPGILIEVEHDNETHQYLIGDINPGRGVCDDCVAFGTSAIVKRYKEVWGRDRRDTDPIGQCG